jgi:hypothetical protein
VLAVALDRLGILKKHGLECSLCDDDGERKASLGCGMPPMVRWDGSLSPMTADFLADRLAEDPSSTPKAVSQMLYRMANLGRACGILGHPWDCCPRFYASKCAPLDRWIAARAWDAAEDIESGIGLDPEEWGGLTDDGRDALRIALNALRWHIHDKAEEARRKESQPKAKKARSR